jgi:Fanconi anemia group M protein
MSGRPVTLFDFGQATTKAESASARRPGEVFGRGPSGSVSHPHLAPGAIAWRDYQVAVALEALTANTLVVLPTGLGKTVIGALVTAECLQKPPGRVLWLAPTRPLCLQHEARLKGWLAGPPPTVAVTGKRRSKERRALESSARIIVATPQVVANDLAAGQFPLASFSLVVFDEGHRAVGDYQYVAIGKATAALPKDKQPLILALTASPGHEEERILEVRRNLLIERVEARTADDLDVAHHVQKTGIEWVRVPFPEEFEPMRDRLEKLLAERVQKLRKMGFLRHKKNTQITKRDVLETAGMISARLKQRRAPYLFAAFLHQGVALHAANCLELLECEGVEAMRAYIARVSSEEPKRKDKAFLNDRHTKAVLRELKGIKGERHPKFPELARLLASEFSGRPRAKAIVFAQYRDTVTTIVGELAKHAIAARKFVGQADRVKEKGMSQDEQRAALAAFERGDFPVLVASSVGEEGIDIPAVDLVVFFEAVPSAIRSIQRRGRAGRTAAGRAVVLITAGTRDEKMAYAGVSREKKMKRLVQGMRQPKTEMKSALDAWQRERAPGAEEE